jgi:hypothetical protein
LEGPEIIVVDCRDRIGRSDCSVKRGINSGLVEEIVVNIVVSVDIDRQIILHHRAVPQLNSLYSFWLNQVDVGFCKTATFPVAWYSFTDGMV